ncbi:MAG: NAD-glutamate dehydrogenase domain-containing protein, partial [Alteraurantiacibacter sp.]
MGLADRPRPRATLVPAPLGRHLFAFVWLPRDMLSTAVRLQVQELLETQSGATTLDWSLMVEGGNLALLRYVMDFRGKEKAPDAEAVDRALTDMLRGWNDAVETALGETQDANRAAALAVRYAESFPAYYRSAYGAQDAATDILRLRNLAAHVEETGHQRDARLYRSEKDAHGALRLKVYQHHGELPLSDAVPALENFGFRVLSEVPSRLSGEDTGTIHDFVLGLPGGMDGDALLAREDAIETAIAAVLNERAEDDVFNRLVIACELDAQEADWLRAFYRYLRQSNIAFTIYTVVDALVGAPKVTRGLVDLLRTLHDPTFDGDRAKAAETIEDDIRRGLADVVAINDDRLLRRYWDTIRAVLRTNAFAPAAEDALAFKLDSSLVPGLPAPVPWREIFVYSRRVEGVHLRAGPVARGGLRWSDRRDDFRTEILGLMKAQKVKNAVIVPTGAKGGFYPKRLPSPAVDRDAWFAEGKESYKLFIRTLLSITDNIAGEKVVHPESVVIHDGEDPYFVVAADKGTATFSDTANAIALERDFWLGDAFASGGSNGYDHKAMGITARGAWVCVQRHFLEMGVDVQKDPVRVVGCGDMSGDVFGNGMLLSKAIKLVAAFDHRHIFIDPDPDPAASWKERKRLFDLERSNWADYSDKVLSKGAGIYARSQKRIKLTKSAIAALDIPADALTDGEIEPDALISQILKSDVDLVWFGGIGTYVKSSHESHAEVGDPASDALRVNAEDMRAKVIGEGANLGVTQAGRIEFALNGGRVNTDFIDNSAGVDCSDNEVNIKIALTAAREAGKLSEERRNELLRDMTEEVAELVLEDNRLQALALSIAEAGGSRTVGAQSRLIELLEDMGGMDRANEGLGDSESLARRAADGAGLTRPELAVLLSHSKLVLQDAVEGSALASDEAADPLVLGDFPPQLQGEFKKQLLTHRLRNEIVGTVVANRIVNRMGMLHPFELAEEEGAGLDAVGSAFVSASALLGMEEVWATLDTADMPETARLMLFDQAALALRGHIADLLRTGGANLSPSELQAQIGDMVQALNDQAESLLGDEARAHVDALAATMVEKGANAKHAAMVARLFAFDGAIGLSRLASDTGIGPVELAGAFIELGAMLGIDWAQSRAAVMSPADPWERLLVSGLARDFQQMRFEFLRGLARSRSKDASDPSAMIATWAEKNETAIAQFRRIVKRARAATPVAPAMLAQIASQARNLLQG